jgi:hypothetical protein
VNVVPFVVAQSVAIEEDPRDAVLVRDACDRNVQGLSDG